MNPRLLGPLLLASLYIAPVATATTWYVDPAGGGDFLTIAEALNAAVTRDTILLATGVHDVGPYGISHDGTQGAASVAILGAGLPHETIIRGGGSPMILLRNTTAEMLISRVTFDDGLDSSSSHALLVDEGALRFIDCRVHDTFHWGALRLDASTVEVVACSLYVPSAFDLIEVGSDGTSRLYISDSYLTGGSSTGNAAENWSGAIERCWISETPILSLQDAVVTHCVISGCRAVSHRGVIDCGDNTTLRNCTIVTNTSYSQLDPTASIIGVRNTAVNVTIMNNIVAFNDGVDLRALSPDVTTACNLLFGNSPIAHPGIAELDPSNIIADPLFCDFANGDYTVDAASPAAPENSGGCGLIGAFPVGCGLPVGAPSAGGSGLALRVTPNPFNPMTKLRIEVAAGSLGTLDLAIFDASGRRVRTLLAGERAAGTEVMWDGRDDDRRTTASGVYLVRLTGRGMAAVARAVLAK